MSNIVIVGAGQTGRGYLNRFFRNEHVIFLDKNKELIDALQAAPSYQVSFGAEREPIVLGNYDAYLIDSPEGMESLAAADIIMISVGGQNLKSVCGLLKEALQMRAGQDVDILTAENGVHVTKDLEVLREDKRVHLAEAIVFCTTVKQTDSLDILSENRDYLPYDVVALGHELPYENMAAEENLDVLMQRKIYTYNCISAVISYLGYYKNYRVYSEAACDADIEHCIYKILEPLNTCICKEYGISREEQESFSDMAVRKFQNKNIADTIERNARNVDRKLGPTERILAPLSIIFKYQKECPELLLVAACAIYYGQKTNTLQKEVDAYFEILPNSWREEIKKKLKELNK